MGCSRPIVYGSTRTAYRVSQLSPAGYNAPRLTNVEPLINAALSVTLAAAFVIGYLYTAPTLSALLRALT